MVTMFDAAEYNQLVADAAERLPFADAHPVARVKWVHVDLVQANDYNPNAVAGPEMQLLRTSIREDGYTQPVVCIWDAEIGKFIIVDGFHRYTVMRTCPEIYDSTNGYLPIVVIDKPIEDRIAATVRHNRARGKHSVAGMSSLVFQMLQAGESDVDIIRKIGLEPQELARLKFITGYAKLHADHEYSRPSNTDRQIKAKAKYKREHPEETVPMDI